MCGVYIVFYVYVFGGVYRVLYICWIIGYFEVSFFLNYKFCFFFYVRLYSRGYLLVVGGIGREFLV